MSHLAVRNLIEDCVRAIDDSVRFAYARASDFNSLGVKEDKRAVLDPLKQSLSFTDNYNLTKTFKVGIVFYKLDDLQGNEEETATILDEMDELSDKFINKLNLFSFEEDSTQSLSSQNTEIGTISKEPVIKVTKDAVTGFVLQFDFTVPDTFNYCSIYD